MWKPVNDDCQSGSCLVKDCKTNVISFANYNSGKKQFIDLAGGYFIQENIKEYCSLTDYINYQEELEKRIERLENFVLNEFDAKHS